MPTNSIGSATLHLDNTLLTPGSQAITPGSVHHFTYFFRDAAGGAAGFNMANGISVVLL